MDRKHVSMMWLSVIDQVSRILSYHRLQYFLNMPYLPCNSASPFIIFWAACVHADGVITTIFLVSNTVSSISYASILNLLHLSLKWFFILNLWTKSTYVSFDSIRVKKYQLQQCYYCQKYAHPPCKHEIPFLPEVQLIIVKSY